VTSLADRFEKRGARAELLAGSFPAVAEPLVFAAKLFRLQGRLAEAVSARHADKPLTGSTIDLPGLVDLLPPLLSFAESDGPPELAEVAVARASDGAETSAARLRVYWEGERESQGDYLTRAFLRPFAEVLVTSGVALERPRHEGHCPACGSAPIVSVRKDLEGSGGGARFLVCGLCATEWPFPRIRCASCQEQDPVKVPSFQSENHPGVRIEACETCRSYIKSLDLTLDARPLPEVDDLVSIAMDLWALEEGWTRLEPGWAGI
jgi:FdhE protein